MNIQFQETDPKKALKAINEALDERDLKKMVSIGLEGEDLVVVISKLGKSRLRFTPGKGEDKGLSYSLTNEKIALSHRAFKEDVTEKIKVLLKDAGGRVCE